MQDGRKSLLIGVAFLAACLTMGNVLVPNVLANEKVTIKNILGTTERNVWIYLQGAPPAPTLPPLTTPAIGFVPSKAPYETGSYAPEFMMVEPSRTH
jgi:hypothetical protein